MSKNTAQANTSKHALLSHKINLGDCMNAITGVTSLYLLGIFFAMTGFVSGYAAGLTSVSSSEASLPTKSAQAEDLDIFVQEILDDEMFTDLDSEVLGVSTQTDQLEMEVFQPIDGEVINRAPVEIQVSEPTSLTIDDSVLVQAPNASSSLNSTASLPEDISTYGLIISMGGMVFGMNLMHEEGEKSSKSKPKPKKTKKVASIA